MTIADEIKAQITMEDVFAAYGFAPNRAGFIPCPFHEEKTPSLSAFDNNEKWHCFGCGESGDVISFVEKLFNINFGQAVIRLNSDFGLNLPVGRPDRRRRGEILQKAADKKRREEEARRALNALTAARRKAWFAIRELSPKSMEDPQNPAFAAALKEIDYLDYCIETAGQEGSENHQPDSNPRIHFK